MVTMPLKNKTLFLLLIIVFIIPSKLVGFGQISFSGLILPQFIYPHAQEDSLTSKLLQQQLVQQHPRAINVKVISLISPDSLMRVVSYYAILTKRPYEVKGNHIIFPLKKTTGIITDRIEIFSQPIPRIASKFWPTRINLIQMVFPLKSSLILSRSKQTLRERVRQFFYDGQLREDIAAILMEELGEGSEVFVIDTNDSFEQVYRFFQRRYGRIRIITSFDNEIRERDFEIDVSSYLQKEKTELHIRVLENPLITDLGGNSFRYIGHVFIQYTFWYMDDKSSP